MENTFVKVQNVHNGRITKVLQSVSKQAWFQKDWVVLKTDGIKKEQATVAETETVELTEENTTEVISEDELNKDIGEQLKEDVDYQIDSLKTEIKALTGTRPRTNDLAKLQAKLQEAKNTQNDGI